MKPSKMAAIGSAIFCILDFCVNELRSISENPASIRYAPIQGTSKYSASGIVPRVMYKGSN